MKNRRMILAIFLVLMVLIPGFVGAQGLSAVRDSGTAEVSIDFLSAALLPGLSSAQLVSDTGPTEDMSSVPNYLGYKLEAKEYEKFSRALLWTKISMGMLALNTASIVLTTEVDLLTGAIISILSFTGWTISMAYMSFNYRDMTNMLKKRGKDDILPMTPMISSLIAYAFGMGTITAIGLSFSDDTGVAAVLAYACAAVSGISGIVAIVSTFTYSSRISYREYKKQLSSLYYRYNF